MADSNLDCIAWELCDLLLKELNVKRFVDTRRGRGEPSNTLQFTKEALGVNVTRVWSVGIINRETVTVEHTTWQISSERVWPDWSQKDPVKRLLGHIKIEVFGNQDGPAEALTWLRLAQ